VASSSSANKVAKLAQKGKGKKVRFQGGTLFPLVIIIVVVLLGSLVVYARQTRPGPGEGEPTANQHWHAALGFYVCDDTHGLFTHPNLTGALEDQNADGSYVSQRFVANGIHSHSDGVMHWHPSSSGKATGTNAKLEVFLKNYGVTLTNSKLVFPADQGGETYEEGKSKCKIDGVEKDASLKLWVWDSYAKVDTEEPQIYTTNMGDVRIKNDGMVFMVAFVPDDTKPKPPETAFNLPELGAADNGGVVATTVPTSDSSGTGTTVAGSEATIADSDTTEAPGATDNSTATSSGEPSDTAGTSDTSDTADSTATTAKSTATTAKPTATTAKPTATTGG